MIKYIFVFIFILSNSFSADGKSLEELRNCYDNGDKKCGYKLAKELRKDIKTEREAYDMFLQLTLMGDELAPTQLGRGYIYSKTMKRNCKKGTTFLFLATKTDPEAIKELALLFKRGICVKKNDKLYKKYIKIYFSEKEKLKNR